MFADHGSNVVRLIGFENDETGSGLVEILMDDGCIISVPETELSNIRFEAARPLSLNERVSKDMFNRISNKIDDEEKKKMIVGYLGWCEAVGIEPEKF